MKKRISAIVFSCLFITSIYFCIDANNLPSSIGIRCEKINWDVASIVIGNLVVICLYLITFYLLDHRKIERDHNQREVALLLLSKTYEECKESVVLFDNPEARKMAVEKCDFNKVMHEDQQMLYYLEYPFEFHEKIVEFACSGIVSKKEFSDYMEVRAAFKKHINVRMISFDHEELPRQTRREFFETFERVKNSLNRGEQ